MDSILRPLPGRIREHAQLTKPILVPVSIGELIDKVTILEIKTEQIGDPAKRRNIISEPRQLRDVRDRIVGSSPALDGLDVRLKEVNEALWRIEVAFAIANAGTISAHASPRWPAPSIGKMTRARLKRQMNEMTGSGIVEENSTETIGHLVECSQLLGMDR